MLTVTAHNGVSRLGTLCVVRSDSETVWSAADQEAVLSAGALLSACAQADSVTIDQQSAQDEWRQMVHRSHALAAAARMLRSDPSDEVLEKALLEVLPTSDAAALFVEINRTDEDGQSVAMVAANAESDGGDVSQPEYWHGMPWDRMPLSRDRLSRGLTNIVRRGLLAGVQAETYAESRIGSELDVPLFRGGDWVGLIGMADGDESFDWSLDVPFLQILGDLVAARFDREGVPAPMDI